MNGRIIGNVHIIRRDYFYPKTSKGRESTSVESVTVEVERSSEGVQFLDTEKGEREWNESERRCIDLNLVKSSDDDGIGNGLVAIKGGLGHVI